LQGSAWRPEWRVVVAKVGGGDQRDRDLFRIALPLTITTRFLRS
jgi:hypothetical protein